MPRRANVLLVQDGLILDCLNRVGPDENRYRLSLPNHDYVPPPPIRGQLDPAQVTESDLRRLAGQRRKTIDAGSAALARAHPGNESALGERNRLPRNRRHRQPKQSTPIAPRFTLPFESVLEPASCSAIGSPASAALTLYQPPISVFPIVSTWTGAKPTPVSAAMQQYFGAITGIDAYQEAKKPVQATIEESRVKLRSKIASLQKGLRDDSELQRLRQSGELILAYQYALSAGQRELRAQYNPDEPELQVTLDPDRSPLENAQNYFRRYEKAKSANEAVPALVNETRLELDFIEQLENDLATASNWLEIDDVIQILQTRGHWQARPSQKNRRRRTPRSPAHRQPRWLCHLARTQQPAKRATHLQNRETPKTSGCTPATCPAPTSSSATTADGSANS